MSHLQYEILNLLIAVCFSSVIGCYTMEIFTRWKKRKFTGLKQCIIKTLKGID